MRDTRTEYFVDVWDFGFSQSFSLHFEQCTWRSNDFLFAEFDKSLDIFFPLPAYHGVII